MKASGYRLLPEEIRAAMDTYEVAEDQVQRDFVISWMLWSIARSTQEVVFYGGTALSRTLLPELRLSEDIDLCPTSARSVVATAIHEGLVADLERGFGLVEFDLRLDQTTHPHPCVYRVGGHAVQVQLVSQFTHHWPTVEAPLDQRYSGPPPVTMRTLTAPGFVAAKTAAWCERQAPRDLYDLWALAEQGLIDQRAADTYAKWGPTGRPPNPALLPRSAPSQADWTRALAHQGKVRVDAATAHATVLGAWSRLRVAGAQ